MADLTVLTGDVVYIHDNPRGVFTSIQTALKTVEEHHREKHGKNLDRFEYWRQIRGRVGYSGKETDIWQALVVYTETSSYGPKLGTTVVEVYAQPLNQLGG